MYRSPIKSVSNMNLHDERKSLSGDDFSDEMMRYDNLKTALTDFQPETIQESPKVPSHQTPQPTPPTTESSSTQLNEILAAINFLGEQVNGLRNEVAASNQRFGVISERIDTLATRQTALDEKVSTFESRLESLERGTVEDDSTSLSRKIDDLEQKALNTKAILTVPTALVADGSPNSGDRTTLIRNHLVSTLNMTLDELKMMTAYRFDDEGKRFILDFYDLSLRPKIFTRFRQVNPQDLYLNESPIRNQETQGDLPSTPEGFFQLRAHLCGDPGFRPSQTGADVGRCYGTPRIYLN